MSETTRTALERFDAAMRDKALNTGQPVPRTACGFPGFSPGRGYLVFRYDPGRRRLTVHEDGKRTATATASHVSRAFRHPDTGALALDRKAANAMAALVPDDDRALALSVAAHRAAPVSLRFTELAAALNARYYAPAGMDVTSGDAWLDVLGAAPREARQAAERAATPEPGASGWDGTLLTTLLMLTGEAAGLMENAVHPGPAAGPPAWIDRNYGFELCEALTEFVTALTVYDPLMRKRGELSGDLIRAEAAPPADGQRAGTVRLRLASPVSVKQGEEVTVLPVSGRARPGPGTCFLSRYVAEDGGLYAVLAKNSKGTGFDVARHAETVLLGNAKAPFLMTPRRCYTRWSGKRLNDRHRPPRKRPVPSYIVLAGGGSGATGVPAG